MNLAELKAAGAFVAPEPVKETVTWNGHTFDVWIKPVSFADSEKMLLALATGDASRGALLLSSSVLLGDDREAMTYEDALSLDPSLAMTLVQTVRKVKDRPKA